jgi:transposase InsO family protein
MPWRESSVVEERLRFAVLATEKGANLAALCRRFGISRQTGHLWRKRFLSDGARALVDRSRRPLSSPGQTAAPIEERIVQLRLERPDWGAAKLGVLLSAQDCGPTPPSPRTVQRILQRRGLVRPCDGHAPATQRFEHAAPNQLWQMDFKGPGVQGVRAGRTVGPLSLLDDHSRYLVSLQQVGSTRLEAVREALAHSFREAGVPDAILTDHGVPWWNAASPWGLTELTVWIMQQGIRLRFSGVAHPQTQGKVERMHQTLERAVNRRGADGGDQHWLDAFRHEYNHLRPHEALQMATPASRWRPSTRAFQATPAPWNYEAAWEVARLSKQGQLRWRHRRWELSRALRHQRVGIQTVGERAIVYFCNTPLRELDLRTGASFAIPTNVIERLER